MIPEKHNLKHIQRIIEKYLKNQETKEERKILFGWFDSVEKENGQFSEESSYRIHAAKERFLSDVLTLEVKSKRPKLYSWLQYAAAAVLLLVGSYFIFSKYTVQQEINVEDLAVHKVDYETPTLTLPSGEVIQLGDNYQNSDSFINTSTFVHEKEGQLKSKGDNKESNGGTIILKVPNTRTFCFELNDGTKVWINAGSTLRYPEQFGEGNRIVQLEGEAYFEVAKTENKSRFLVETDNQTVEVLGTKFNVKAYPNQNRTFTTLQEGLVQVNSKVSNTSSVYLKPNQQSEFSSSDFIVREVDVENILAWKNGFFYFNGQNTSEVLKNIASWYNIDITYKESLNQSQYVGKIPQDLKLNEVVELLEFADLKVKPILKNNRVNLIIN